MERLRGRFEETLREIERLSQQELAPPRPQPGPDPRRRAVPDREGTDAEPWAARPQPPTPRRRPPADREGADAEPRLGARGEVAPPTPPVAPPLAPLREGELRAALGSRAALRQAFFLREILGPPRALQDPRDEGRGGF